MNKFFGYFALGVFIFGSSYAIESRYAIELDGLYPESPSIHAYNGFSDSVGYNVKLVTKQELGDQSPQQFAKNYYKDKSKARDNSKANYLCEVDINVQKLREIFDLPASETCLEFYIILTYSSRVIHDPFHNEDQPKKEFHDPFHNKDQPKKGFHDPLYRPHYAYYTQKIIGSWGNAAQLFKKAYNTDRFVFFDEYCKTRTCFIDAKRGALFANQCWRTKEEQKFSIHRQEGSNSLIFSDKEPTIDAVKSNANKDNSCAVFYASKLPSEISSSDKSKREICGLILILNEADEQQFYSDLESGGLLKALINNKILKRSNTALEIFPNLWSSQNRLCKLK